MNQIATENSQYIQREFKKLNLKQEIVDFMISYFKNHIITRSQPNKSRFKDTIDTANKELLSASKNIINDQANKPSEDDIKRVKIWQEAHFEFEKIITLELIEISKKLPV